MSSTVSPAFLVGSTTGALYLVSADGTTAVSISQADYEVFVYNGYPVYEVSQDFVAGLRVVA
ncbi:MAG TPA: hypothetical protein VN886_05530 [Acidimicrobiales bacterium]|nr:hypothetical protein [Acidimicrobiales bacterium]